MSIFVKKEDLVTEIAKNRVFSNYQKRSAGNDSDVHVPATKRPIDISCLLKGSPSCESMELIDKEEDELVV